LLASVVLTAAFMSASAFDSVRAHPLYGLSSAVFSALVCGLASALTGGDVFLLIVTGLALLGVVVELYNYRHGTSSLRLDFIGADS
jgi:hypothetical protein